MEWYKKLGWELQRKEGGIRIFVKKNSVGEIIDKMSIGYTFGGSRTRYAKWYTVNGGGQYNYFSDALKRVRKCIEEIETK